MVFPSSGTYTISLVAIGSGGTDITTQNINIVVSGAPVASFNPLTNPIYVPNATAYFVNTSSNANSYSWNFGNGATSIDENPWTIYSTPGTYTVTLIVSNGLCGSDTNTFDVEVINNVGINENKLFLSEINLYPNPISTELNIELKSKENTIVLIDVYNIIGEIILTESFKITKGLNKINSFNNIASLAKGQYSMRLITKNNVYTKTFIKQ